MPVQVRALGRTGRRVILAFAPRSPFNARYVFDDSARLARETVGGEFHTTNVPMAKEQPKPSVRIFRDLWINHLNLAVRLASDENSPVLERTLRITRPVDGDRRMLAAVMEADVKVVPRSNLPHLRRPHMRPSLGDPGVFGILQQPPPGLPPMDEIAALEDVLMGGRRIILSVGLPDGRIRSILPPDWILVFDLRPGTGELRPRDKESTKTGATTFIILPPPYCSSNEIY